VNTRFSDELIAPIPDGVDVNLLREAQDPETGVNAIWGKWPGEETDEETAKIIEALS
jgi:hypothetical protein